MRDLFEVLGVRRAFHLSAEELEEKFLALSKQLHPDRFAKAGPRERMLALTRTTELNDAYRTLKNETRRAEYLLKLEGLDIAEERPSSVNGKDQRVKVDPSLLMEMMELNEQLADARADDDHERVKALAAEVAARRAEARRTVDAGFSAYESGDRAALNRIAQALIAMRYHARFFEQVEAFESGKEREL
jgi:molecular chaperone HscB